MACDEGPDIGGFDIESSSALREDNVANSEEDLDVDVGNVVERPFDKDAMADIDVGAADKRELSRVDITSPFEAMLSLDVIAISEEVGILLLGKESKELNVTSGVETLISESVNSVSEGLEIVCDVVVILSAKEIKELERSDAEDAIVGMPAGEVLLLLKNTPLVPLLLLKKLPVEGVGTRWILMPELIVTEEAAGLSRLFIDDGLEFDMNKEGGKLSKVVEGSEAELNVVEEGTKETMSVEVEELELKTISGKKDDNSRETVVVADGMTKEV